MFQANAFTKGDQRWPEIAVSYDGRSIVTTWSSDKQHRDGWSVVGRRFDWSGKPAGGEFALDDFRGGTFPNAEDPKTDFDAAGNFVIAWHVQGTDGDERKWTIFERRYHADGTPFGPGKRVPTDTIFDHWRPTVMVAGNGDAMVTWYAERDAANGDKVSDIKGRMLNARDEFAGDEIQISGTAEMRRLQWRQGAVSRKGHFAPFWYAEKPSMTGFVRLFDRNGVARSPELTFPDFVNAGARANGDVLVSFGGKGQWITASGQPSGQPLQVRIGEIAMNDDGAFVVISVNEGPQGHGLYAYPYDHEGHDLSQPILLSKGHKNLGGPPHVDMSQNGVIVATWEEGGGTDGDGASVWGAITLHPSYRRRP